MLGAQFSPMLQHNASDNTTSAAQPAVQLHAAHLPSMPPSAENSPAENSPAENSPAALDFKQSTASTVSNRSDDSAAAHFDNSQSIAQSDQVHKTINAAAVQQAAQSANAVDHHKGSNGKGNNAKGSNGKDGNGKDGNGKGSNGQDSNGQDSNGQDSNDQDSNDQDSNSQHSNSNHLERQGQGVDTCPVSSAATVAAAETVTTDHQAAMQKIQLDDQATQCVVNGTHFEKDSHGKAHKEKHEKKSEQQKQQQQQQQGKHDAESVAWRPENMVNSIQGATVNSLHSDEDSNDKDHRELLESESGGQQGEHDGGHYWGQALQYLDQTIQVCSPCWGTLCATAQEVMPELNVCNVLTA